MYNMLILDSSEDIGNTCLPNKEGLFDFSIFIMTRDHGVLRLPQSQKSVEDGIIQCQEVFGYEAISGRSSPFTYRWIAPGA